ncbi:MAG: TetR/AcrR family transcriptional regulator [bacterium]|nr:TetR/AcrR family transcriptional regulator [bacterium]
MSKGEQTRMAILDTALSECSRVGLGGLSIGNLARLLDMSKSGLFAHFDSKENLQLQVLQNGRDRFVVRVLAPALQAPRGIPRLEALFEHWLEWADSPFLQGGCIFASTSTELAAQPGALRDCLLSAQRDWLGTIAEMARAARREEHFHEELDPEQFAWEFHSMTLAYHYFSRLIRDPEAQSRARNSFQNLIRASRA